MYKKIMIIILAFIVTACMFGCSTGADDVIKTAAPADEPDSEAYKLSKQALSIADEYLDTNTDADTAASQLYSIYESLETMRENEEDKYLSIEILTYANRVLELSSAIKTADSSSIFEARNALAEALNMPESK